MSDKRFRLVKCVDNYWGIIDKELESIDELFIMSRDKNTMNYLHNLLNQVTFENQRFKQFFKQRWSKMDIYLKDDIEEELGDIMEIHKLKIMLSSPMQGKTDEEINNERNEMANLLFDKYGEENCEIFSSVIEDHKEKSELECFSESILFMSQCDVLAMGFGWKNSRGCKLEHQIAKEYDVPVIYLDQIKSMRE